MTGEPHGESTPEPSVALVLGGGGARGLAHLGLLEVLESAGLRPTLIAGTSIGGLIGALYASSGAIRDIADMARGFRFPRRFAPGGTLVWDEIFAPAVPRLTDRTFEDLALPLAVSTVDLESGDEVVLRHGPLLPAIRATCAVPGAIAPERLGGRYLVDGGIVNILPVDVAWSWQPDVVIAVNIGSSLRRSLQLDTWYARAASRMGRILPNPMTAQVAYEIAMRAVEIALDRQRALAIAMTGPEVLIDVDLGDVAIGDFHRLDEVVEMGRRATLAAMPDVRVALAAASRRAPAVAGSYELHIDPVCRMAISPGRARDQLRRDGVTYYFCSTNCRSFFERHLGRYGTQQRGDCTGAEQGVRRKR